MPLPQNIQSVVYGFNKKILLNKRKELMHCFNSTIEFTIQKTFRMISNRIDLKKELSLPAQ